MSETLIATLQRYMADNAWHLSSEIASNVSHRFSAIAYDANQRGLYSLDRRWNANLQQWEYKLAKASRKSSTQTFRVDGRTKPEVFAKTLTKKLDPEFLAVVADELAKYCFDMEETA